MENLFNLSQFHDGPLVSGPGYFPLHHKSRVKNHGNKNSSARRIA
jgi:hypothetical protein